MGRSRAAVTITHRTRTGGTRERGLDISPQDFTHVQLLARWYCMTSMQIAATEMTYRAWHPDTAKGDVDVLAGQRSQLTAKAASVTRRLQKLASIKPSTHDGPLVLKKPIEYRTDVWSPTMFGGRVADTPWKKLGPVSWSNVHHALLAGDIGIQFTNRFPRLPLVSQRELSTGMYANGDDLPIDCTSPYNGAAGTISIT